MRNEDTDARISLDIFGRIAICAIVICELCIVKYFNKCCHVHYGSLKNQVSMCRGDETCLLHVLSMIIIEQYAFFVVLNVNTSAENVDP